jgi:uncharacterized protein YqfB (UPF0267 family)
MNYQDKSIGFAKNLVPLIENGTKTLTYRMGDKYNFLEVGDQIAVSDSSNSRVFAEIDIIEKSHTTFGNLPTDRKGHEVYHSKEDQRATFKKYYQKNIEDSEPILVLGFKVIKLLT